MSAYIHGQMYTKMSFYHNDYRHQLLLSMLFLTPPDGQICLLQE